VLVPQAETQFGVISDVDDTVLESRVTHRPTQAKLTFLYNARTRKPLEGVAELYRALQCGTGKGAPINPIFYVSSSPWNLYDLIDDFFELNGIPHGPILLRDLAFGPRRFAAFRSHDHKLDNIRRLFGHFPRLRWVLIGDSGQHDAMLYAAAIEEFPGRVIAVYIRDIDPNLASRRDAFVDRYIAEAAALGVPMLRVRDSNAIAEHAVGLGLLKTPDLDAVAGDADRDRQRPTPSEADPSI
jgi:phosphatidate phosphatase APP1